MYDIGTYLVKDCHGVCRIDGIQSMAVPHSSRSELYYRLTPLEEKGTTLYVPAEGPQDDLRAVILLGRQGAQPDVQAGPQGTGPRAAGQHGKGPVCPLPAAAAPGKEGLLLRRAHV